MEEIRTKTYRHLNHPEYALMKIVQCYLCGKPLDGEVNKDHVIPNCMFPKSAGYRPQLHVHKRCNDNNTMLDRRVKMRILSVCALNPIAENTLLNDLLLPAMEQKELVNVIGASRAIKDYKLARTIDEDFRYNLDVIHEGRQLVQFRTSKKHTSELKGYAAKMTRGLFIRNVSLVDPGRPKLYLIDGNVLKLQNRPMKDVLKPVEELIQEARGRGALFGQVWPGHIGYVGSAYSKGELEGFVWLEFYDSYGMFALFPRRKPKA